MGGVVECGTVGAELTFWVLISGYSTGDYTATCSADHKRFIGPNAE
jgi:hypothetical protein